MSASNYRFRDYRSADFEQLFTLDQICFPEPFSFSRADMRRYVRSPQARILVAETEGGIGGFCMIHMQTFGAETVAYVTTIDVHPAHRRMGLARAMLLEMEARAAQEGAANMLLHVFVENSAAMTLYESFGYTVRGAHADFYGPSLHAHIYGKTISR